MQKKYKIAKSVQRGQTMIILCNHMFERPFQ